jgi:hypothetical protein
LIQLTACGNIAVHSSTNCLATRSPKPLLCITLCCWVWLKAIR